MQTTYENFRYRYDKKENPYHKGVRGNCGEVFCSNIPPSMNDFRSFVNEDDNHGIVRSLTPDLGEGGVSSKEKIDIEMGGRIPEDNSYPLPNILRDLDYDDLEHNLKSTEEDRRHGLDAFFPVDAEAKDSLRISSGGRGRIQHSPARDRVRESLESSFIMDPTLEGHDGRSNSRRKMDTQA